MLHVLREQNGGYIDSLIDSWVLDLGATFYTTTHWEIMENYVSRNDGNVNLEDDELVDIVGIGDICLKMSNGSMWKIHKVRLVPKLMCNLILVGQLDNEGHNVIFIGAACEVMKGSMVFAQGNKIGTLYMTSSYRDMIFVIDSNTNSDYDIMGLDT